MSDYQWGVEHRSFDGTVAGDIEMRADREDAELTLRPCRAAGLTCQLLRREVTVGAWVAVTDPEADQ